MFSPHSDRQAPEGSPLSGYLRLFGSIQVPVASYQGMQRFNIRDRRETILRSPLTEVLLSKFISGSGEWVESDPPCNFLFCGNMEKRPDSAEFPRSCYSGESPTVGSSKESLSVFPMFRSTEAFIHVYSMTSTLLIVCIVVKL